MNNTKRIPQNVTIFCPWNVFWKLTWRKTVTFVTYWHVLHKVFSSSLSTIYIPSKNNLWLFHTAFHLQLHKNQHFRYLPLYRWGGKQKWQKWLIYTIETLASQLFFCLYRENFKISQHKTTEDNIAEITEEFLMSAEPGLELSLLTT